MSDPVESSVDQEIADQVGAGMYARDFAAQKMGIRLEAIGPGTAVVTMPVSDDMVNGHDIGHGGFTFTLADTCFAYACNSYNKNAVARHCEISFIKPTRRGDVLTATGREVHKAGRSGTYDITVTDQTGEVVALFRGHSRIVEGEVVPDLTIMT
ncbi:MAG: hydroxyphenylacetyl-CoA thioesterase PaaI [Alphaproteobacteria bacterium]|nr:hydroxyphenylacetyl-CoA thioesterase PaaI [Alphaproteobacteria bacterium]